MTDASLPSFFPASSPPSQSFPLIDRVGRKSQQTPSATMVSARAVLATVAAAALSAVAAAADGTMAQANDGSCEIWPLIQVSVLNC